MRYFSLKSLAFCMVLITASSASAQQMVRADSVAAGAIWAQKLSVTESVTYCEAYVAGPVKELLAVVVENWTAKNDKYLRITDIIRGEIVKAVTAASGEGEAMKFVNSWGERDKVARARVRAGLDQMPADSREGKCYGIIKAINEGKFDIGTSLPEDAKHLDARAPVMGW